MTSDPQSADGASGAPPEQPAVTSPVESASDAGGPTETPDAQTPDAQTPDAQTPDAQTPDAQTAQTAADTTIEPTAEAQSDAAEVTDDEAPVAEAPIAEAPVAEASADEEGPAEVPLEEQGSEDAKPIELLEDDDGDDDQDKRWYILKVQVNREESICDALRRRVKIEGLERYFGDIVVPTEDVAEFSKSGKRRVVKKKLYPGYIMVNMVINDDTWFLVRETPGIGDFTGAAGKPVEMDPKDVERIISTGKDDEGEEHQVKTAIPFEVEDRVRVKDGNFENFEGHVDAIDEANGRVTVMISIFGRSTPVEFEHWQIEKM